ncbi:MAG: hypothetical protein HN353_00360 [Bdellovibrionales bacterium]|jgi:hypothetical protein|nr:hypothetical protein [Bdellovibrionales bacterium]MBT3526414.1 hypothetical protein [Bdellovibrionales bacterium]MBT7669382.1 hypothetical protein [Bdellovibrionales bacterium]MBT7768134.1 hypothetical protein [Bdellovibrionales bacterium]
MMRLRLTILLAILSCNGLFFSFSAASEPTYIPPIVTIQVQGVVTEIFIGSQTLKSGLDQDICITFIETSEQKTIGLVENYDDCFWARSYQERVGDDIDLAEITASVIVDLELLEALDSFRENTEYILSNPY